MRISLLRFNLAMIFHLYLQIPYLALQTVLLITKEIIYFPFFSLISGIESAEHSADQGISIYCTQRQ